MIRPASTPTEICIGEVSGFDDELWILRQDASAAANDSVCYALINAADGTLIDASFR